MAIQNKKKSESREKTNQNREACSHSGEVTDFNANGVLDVRSDSRESDSGSSIIKDETKRESSRTEGTPEHENGSELSSETTKEASDPNSEEACARCSRGECKTGERCVLSFLKSLQERYFRRYYKPENEGGLPETYFVWQHRLGAQKVPADDFINVVRADTLTKVVQYNSSDDCLLQWICENKNCEHNKSDSESRGNDIAPAQNRRLLILEYPFLLNFCANNRLKDWKYDANEILQYYETYAEVFKGIPTCDAFDLVEPFCGFLSAVCGAKDAVQAPIDINGFVGIIEPSAGSTENDADGHWYSCCKRRFKKSPYFDESYSDATVQNTDTLGCKKCCTKTTDVKSSNQQKSDKIAIGKISAALVYKLFVSKNTFYIY